LRLRVAPGDPAVFEFDFVRVRVAIDPPPSANLGLLEPKRWAARRGGDAVRR
jgi:hypothetical protein